MDYTLSSSVEDLGQLAGLSGGSPIVCTTTNDSGFATRHTVIVEGTSAPPSILLQIFIWNEKSQPPLCSSSSSVAACHDVVAVVEGLGFEAGRDRRYYVKLSLENAQWHTQPSLKSRNPAWREYFIGYV
jgi:hypothetical protein